LASVSVHVQMNRMREGTSTGFPSKPAEVPSYFPALDGLRFFCAAGVVLAHSFGETAITGRSGSILRNFVTHSGNVGVDVFFSLSGFLITGLLLSEISKRGTADLKAFYVRRTLRIWPVYYVAVLAGFGGVALLGTPFCRLFGYTFSPTFFRVALPAHLVFLGNWTDRALPTPIAILWSVCIEEQFYILFPITFVFARRAHPAFRAAGLGWLMALVVRAAASSSGAGSYYNTFAHADNLLAGALLAQTLHARPAVVIAAYRRMGLLGELAGLLGFVVLLQWGYGTKSLTASLVFGVFSAIVTTYFVGISGLGCGPIAGFLARPRLRILGQLTYATYCFHLYPLAAVWQFVNRIAPTVDVWWRATLRFILALPLALLVAYLCRVTFELRFLKLKERFQRLPSKPEPLEDVARS
jgi:peptidoglycan/LPS O-acetylase OafA/YrhL